MDTHKKFVEEFYNLFNSSDLGLYIGSREQARLTLQLKLNRFIPLKYIERAFKNFIACNLIIDTGETKEISKKIGLKYFRNTSQKIYMRNVELDSIEDVLRSLNIVFQDFDIVTSEVVQKDDIKRIRQLEKEKDIDIKSLLKYRDFNSNMDFSDVGLLYSIPRDKIFEFIAVLETYNPISAKQQEDKDFQEREYQEKEHLSKWELVKEKSVILIKNVLKLDNVLNISIELSSLFRRNKRVKVGALVVKNIEFKTGKLKIKNTDFCIEFEIQEIAVDIKELTLTINSEGTFFIVKLNPQLQQELYILEKLMDDK